MRRCTCTVVLVGSNTANRKWINHEIIKSWNDSMGIVGIYIHGLKNSAGEISKKGDNPFSYIDYGNNGKKAVFYRALLRSSWKQQSRAVRVD